ncbi:MAG: DeoR/GlpR family DNA-binding transcription regulator [Kiritimatiellales bacterium]|nr:DeoR/GlpR family DNA-binding transcription regulator [Kiritimatiellales bacterium]
MRSRTEKTLAPEREKIIRTLLRERRVVRVEELCKELHASPATVRRDLADMEKKGVLRRVHGGAVSVESRLEEPLAFDDKTAIAAREKRRIAKAALALIQPNDTIYLDGGSTTLDLARLLKDRTDITLVTNSLRAAAELSGGGPRLILVGGELRRQAQTIVGTLTAETIKTLHFDKAIMGTIGMTLKEGLTTTDPGEAFTKQQAMSQAGEVILLAHSEKIGGISFAHFGDVDCADHLITDKGIPEPFKKQLQKMNIKVTVV